MDNKADNKNSKKKKPTFVNYSGLGIQTVAIIGAGTYIGTLLDDMYQFEKNWFTLIMILVSVAFSMIYTIRTLNNWNK